MQIFWDFLSFFVSDIFKLTRRNPVSRPCKTGFRFGYKGDAIFRIWEQRICVMLSDSYTNVSAALSLLNKVYNSFYSKKYALRVNFVNRNRTNKQSCGGDILYICIVCPNYAQFGRYLILDLYAFLFDQMVLLRPWKVICFVLDRRHFQDSECTGESSARGSMYWKKLV